MTTRIELTTAAAEHKKRLDDFLFDRFNGLSKMYLREIVKTEKCEVNGRLENAGYKLRENDYIEIELDPSRETAMRPERIQLDIVFEDESLIVVNKPAGMLVHPTHRDKSGTLLNALTYYLNQGRNTSGSECVSHDTGKGTLATSRVSAFCNTGRAFIRPGLIHRLDKQTSGLMVVAKTSRAHRILADHFHRKLVGKKYLALVDGIVADDDGVIDAPIGRFAERKFWDLKEDGKASQTKFRILKRLERSTLVELDPVTGRTNQLRIHCASIGHPIIGDTARGGREFTRLCLHACQLGFNHPVSAERKEFAASTPDEMTGFTD